MVCDYDTANKVISCSEVSFDEKIQAPTRKKGEPHSCRWIDYEFMKLLPEKRV